MGLLVDKFDAVVAAEKEAESECVWIATFMSGWGLSG